MIQRTKAKEGKKIHLYFDYNINYITVGVSYCNSKTFTYSGVGYEKSERLLKLFYELIEMNIEEIEKKLDVVMSPSGITDDRGKSNNPKILNI